MLTAGHCVRDIILPQNIYANGNDIGEPWRKRVGEYGNGNDYVLIQTY